MTSISASKPLLLWLDLTHDRSTEGLIAQFRASCDCQLAHDLLIAKENWPQQPDMICIHFDRPDLLGLNWLLEVKRSFPSIPLTMFTVQHSEELAVWAMRSRVWEYMVLPFSIAEQSRYLKSLEQLCQLRRSAKEQSQKPLIEHFPALPDSIRRTADHQKHQKHQALEKALLYIDQHFRESIDQKVLAQRCGMTPFRFSRLFKEVNGTGFVEYILNKRMECAKDLLDNSQMPITSIGYEVGFKDPSYFARAFKQCVGCTASEYRQKPGPNPSSATAVTAEPAVDDALVGVVESLAAG